jgi:hypothetical protein
MTSKILRWLRHRRWAIEDSIVLLIDRVVALLPEKKPYYPPAPRQTPEPEHVGFSCCGVSLSRSTPELVDAEFTREILQRLAANQIFDIQYHDR